MCDPQYRFGERERRNVDVLIAQALAEDLGQIGDITSTAIIPSHARGAARLVARSPGVLAGMAAVERLVAEFELIDNWEPLPGRRRFPRAGQPDRARARADAFPAGDGANRPQLSSAAQRDRDLDGAVRGGGRRHPGRDL